MSEEKTKFNLVCTPYKKAITQSSKRKGHQWWKRDVFHIHTVDETTLCGIKCKDWLRLEPRSIEDTLKDTHCCQRCSKIWEAAMEELATNITMEEVEELKGKEK